MKKQIFKWTSIALLLSVCIFCAYTYDKLFQTTQEETITPPKEDLSTPVVTPTPMPEPEIPHTEFPKLSIPSPYSSEGFLQNLGGSEDDSIFKTWAIGDKIFAISNSNSQDYDISSPSPFVATITSNGTVTKTLSLPPSSTVLSSTLYSSGLVVAYSGDVGLSVVFLDGELRVVHTARYDVQLSQCKLLFSQNGIYCAGVSVNTLFLARILSDFSSTSSKNLPCDGIREIVDFSFLKNRLLVLLNREYDFGFYTFDQDLTTNSTAPFPTFGKISAQSAVPSVVGGLFHYTLCANYNDTITLLSVNERGEISWSKSLSRATSSSLLLTPNGNLLVFCATDTASTASLFCSHGDVIEQNVLSLSSLFPVDFTYTDSMYILCENRGIDGFCLLRFDQANLVTTLCRVESGKPISLCSTTTSLIVGLSGNCDHSPYDIGYGKTDGFLLSFSL